MSTIDLEPIHGQLGKDITASSVSAAQVTERAAGFVLLTLAAPVIATSALAVAALCGGLRLWRTCASATPASHFGCGS